VCEEGAVEMVTVVFLGVFLPATAVRWLNQHFETYDDFTDAMTWSEWPGFKVIGFRGLWPVIAAADVVDSLLGHLDGRGPVRR